MKKQRFLPRSAAVAVACVMTTLTSADVLFEQHFDLVEGYSSERNTDVYISSSADDFTVTEAATINEIRASFGQWDFNIPVSSYELEIRVDRNGVPGRRVYRNRRGVGTETGQSFPGCDYCRIWDVVWTMNDLELDPGTYWIICRGVGTNQQDQRAFWLTANTGAPQGEVAHWYNYWHTGDPNYPPDQWYPWYDPDYGGDQFDFAFSLSGEGAIQGFSHEPARIGKIKITDGDNQGSKKRDLIESDDRRFNIQSANTRGNHRVTIQTTARNDLIDSPVAVDVTVETQNTHPRARSIVWIKDWTTGKWKRLGRSSVGPRKDTLQRFPGLDPARYVHPVTGRILIRVRQDTTGPRDRSFEMRIDLIEVRVRGE